MSRSFSSRSLHAISHMLVCCLGRAGTHISPVAVLEDLDVRAVLDFTGQAVPLVTDPDTEEVFPDVQSCCGNHDV